MSNVKIELSKNKQDNCNTCHTYDDDIYRVSFKVNPSWTVIRLCSGCLKELASIIEKK